MEVVSTIRQLFGGQHDRSTRFYCQIRKRAFLGGLVGQWSFSILSDVHPKVTLCLSMAFASIPSLLLYRRPNKDYFMECVAYANLCGFVWGYHVHEKAILTVSTEDPDSASKEDVT